MGFLGSIGSTIFGNGEDPGMLGGILGTSSYKPRTFTADPNAFKNEYAKGNQEQLAAALQGSQGRMGALGQEDPFRNQQLQLANALQAQAYGTGPSIAQNQLKQATQQNIANMQGAIASNRSVNPGLAMRMAGQNTGMLNQQAELNAADLALKEQQMGQQQLGNVLGMGRQGDVGTASVNNPMTQYYQQAMLDQQEAERQAKIRQQELNAGIFSNAETNRSNAYNQKAGRMANMATSLGSALALGAMMPSPAPAAGAMSNLPAPAPALNIGMWGR